MSVQLEVSLDLSGESLSVYYPKEDTKINITVVPALNCYNQVPGHSSHDVITPGENMLNSLDIFLFLHILVFL